MKKRPKTFWDYSISIWNDSDTKSAFLRIQNRHNNEVDINIMILCIWSAFLMHEGLRINFIKKLVSGTNKWRKNILIPTRTIRQKLTETSLGGNNLIIFKHIKNLELEVEKEEQIKLEEIYYSHEHINQESIYPKIVAKNNLKKYFSCLKILPKMTDIADINQILGIIFNDDQ